MADVVLTDRISGLPATFLRGSIVQAGLDPDALPDRLELFKPNLPEGIKAWRDVWSGGHGVGSIIDTPPVRSEEHTSELQSLMRISYAVFCLKKKTKTQINQASIQ